MRLPVGLFIFFCSLASAAPVAPAFHNGTDAGVTARVFKDIGPFVALVEADAANQAADRVYQSVLVGGYYGLSENWSVGGFYRRAQGLRHDGDWLKTNGEWSWADTRHRGEDLVVLDATGKMIFDFLPGEHWVGEVKSRFSENLFNGEQDVMVRPGLTYFWLKESRPFVNFFAQFEMDFAVNYADRELNERWFYLGSLYHVNSWLDAGGFIANKWQAWHSSREYLDKGGRPYTATLNTQVFTGLLVVHLD